MCRCSSRSRRVSAFSCNSCVISGCLRMFSPVPDISQAPDHELRLWLTLRRCCSAHFLCTDCTPADDDVTTDISYLVFFIISVNLSSIIVTWELQNMMMMIYIYLSLCLSGCSLAYLRNLVYELCEMLCTCYLRFWLGYLLSAMWYITYFRFCSCWHFHIPIMGHPMGHMMSGERIV